MSIQALCLQSVIPALGVLSFLLSLSAHAQEGRRGVTVRDAISMTCLADRGYFLGASPSEVSVAHFSPDGKRFAVVLEKGNLENNTNEFSLILFETSEVFRSADPQVLLTMSSSSNKMAIQDIKWLDDNKTIVFIGETPGQIPELYTFNVDAKHLERITNHSTPIVSYDISADGSQVIFEALPPALPTVDSKEAQRRGIVIRTQYLGELLAGDSYGYHVTITEGDELFLASVGDPEEQVSLEDRLGSGQPSLAPDGLHAIVRVSVRDTPKDWSGYQDADLQKSINREREKGVASSLTRYMLIDTKTKAVEPLINAPSEGHKAAVLWAADGKSVVFSGTYLPLDILDPVEREARTRGTYVVEVRIQDKRILKISDKDLKLASWDRKKKRILLESGYWWKTVPPASYEKIDSIWKETPIRPGDTAARTPLDVTLEEDMNSPPRIFASDSKTQQRILLLDLNPQFRDLEFGKVEAISWKATDGHEVLGGLYLPPDFSPSKSYPLVIQTHGFTPDRFRIDGPWSGAFAAQPLASKGFIVLQVGGSKDHDEDKKYVNTQREGAREQAAYEGAIDYLDRRGLIDRQHVGIIGFSRTVYEVGYTLTHSRYKFAAVTVADGIDAGYFQYLAFFPNPQDSELLNGAPPIGEGLSLWLKNSPTFNLDKISTPMRIEAYGPGAILEGWEWFAILSRRHQPIDFIYLPGATHLLVKPWERMVSQQGNVDWFTFWLKGQEDPDPNKREQYLRWHCLREPKTGCDSALLSSDAK